MATTTAVNNLDSYFTSLINNLMQIESQPLQRLQTQKDSINVRSAVYSDVATQLSDLQSAVYDLMSSNYDTELKSGRSLAISGVSTGYTVASATASNSAVVGDYTIDKITQLAKEHRVRSDQQAYADQALGLKGTILVGGAANASVTGAAYNASVVNDPTQGGFATSTVATNQVALGDGSYYVETRQDPTNGWQFRLVDNQGKAANILKVGTTDNEFTSDWQSIPTGGGSYDTGRGLKFTFASGSYVAGSWNQTSPTAASVTYHAQGASISIDATDSLNQIAAKIDDQNYAEGNGVNATIVNRQLILSSVNSGAEHSILASDVTPGQGQVKVLQSLGLLDSSNPQKFSHEMQVGQNAKFYVNDLYVERSTNSGLTDVISGVTLNLAADAVGQSAKISISEDNTNASTAIDNFITKFNSLQTYLDAKTGVDITTLDDGSTTYTRGSLADDNVFSDLRSNLYSIVTDTYSTGGKYSSLRDLGISMDDNLQISVTDAGTLENAMSSNMNGVISLMDTIMSKIDSQLGMFTGKRSTSDYLDDVNLQMTNELHDISSDISNENTRLNERQAYLVNYYADYQAQLINLSYSQQMWNSIYGSVSRSA